MTVTAYDLFDEQIQKTQTWLKEILEELDWDYAPGAYLALRATLHALRDRLSVDEAAHLGAQLPMLVRGIYFEGWKPAGKPRKERHKQQFLAHIERSFRNEPEPVDAEQIARAVLRVVDRHVTRGQIEDVKDLLPAELCDLWP